MGRSSAQAPVIGRLCHLGGGRFHSDDPLYFGSSVCSYVASAIAVVSHRLYMLLCVTPLYSGSIHLNEAMAGYTLLAQ